MWYSLKSTTSQIFDGLSTQHLTFVCGIQCKGGLQLLACSFCIPKQEIWFAATELSSNQVCNDFCVEPLTDEALAGASAITEDGARLDIAANGFWGDSAFFDVHIFNPYAPPTLAATHRKHEQCK